jgi:hypothetical protein
MASRIASAVRLAPGTGSSASWCGSIAGGPRRSSEGNDSAALIGTSGRMAANTQRHPTCSAIVPETAGPMRPGNTHAVESSANIVARARSSKARPMAAYATGGITPVPSPWRKRPATRISMFGAAPAIASPAANRAMPTA